jgi:hypothetical protein
MNLKNKIGAKKPEGSCCPCSDQRKKYSPRLLDRAARLRRSKLISLSAVAAKDPMLRRK